MAVDEDVLADKAGSICIERFGAVLGGGVLTVRTRSQSIEWVPELKRNVFTRSMSVWHDYSSFEVTLDARGEVVGFADHGQYLLAAEASQAKKATLGDVQPILDGEPVVPSDVKVAAITDTQPSPGVFRASLRRPNEARYEVDLDGSDRSVIAVRPPRVINDDEKEKTPTWKDDHPFVGKASAFIMRRFERRLENSNQHAFIGELPEKLSPRFQSVKSRGGLSDLTFSMAYRLSLASAQLNALNGEVMGWYLEGLANGSRAKLSIGDATTIAERAGNPGSNGKLVEATYEEFNGNDVFLARWEHLHDGVPIEGDMLLVRVNGTTGEPFSMHRKWHEIDGEYAER